MTDKELTALVGAIGPVVRDYVDTSLKAYEPRVAALEARPLPKDGEPGPSGERGQDGAPGPAGERGPEGSDGTSGRDGRDGLPGVPGPPGDKGQDGTDGANGAPGRDGTLENIKAMYDGERTLTLCFKDGTPIDGGVIRFPIVIHRGVYQDGKTYDQADSVTWAGSSWLCHTPTTTKPGDGSKAWTLIVKRGRDGRDGIDATARPLPTVTVK